MSFEVLANKSVSGEIAHVEWCPTMDLIALVTADSQLMVHRPNGWQRLFVITGFDHPITCVAWQPDGLVLAIGHSDGSLTLFDVEEGEQLNTTRAHEDALSSFNWVLAADDGSAKDSPHHCPMKGLFAPLPQMVKQPAAVQQYLLDDGPLQLDVALYKICFEAETNLAFDIAVTADAGARVHLAVHGRFSLGCVSIGALPALEFAQSPPKLLNVKLAASLHALTVIVQTAGPAHALLPDGTKQEHAQGTLLLAFRTGQLTRANLEIRALALSYMQCEALASRAKAAIEICGKLWSEAVSPLHSKMSALDQELKQNNIPGTVAEHLTMLLGVGLPSRPACLQTFMLRELKEADLTRLLKGIDIAAKAVLQTLITQAHPALEMLIQRLSHLHGLSKWPFQFAALGLQPARVATAIEAAVGVRQTAELLLINIRRGTPELSALISWLIRVHRKARDEAPPSAEEMAPLDAKALVRYLRDPLNVGSGDGLPFDRIADLFLGQDPNEPEPESPPGGLPDDDLAKLAQLPDTLRLPASLRLLDKDLNDCFSPVAQHVSAGFQLHSCTSLDASAEPAAPPAADGAPSAAYDLFMHEPVPAGASNGTKRSGATSSSTTGLGEGSGKDGGALQSPLLLLSPQKDGSALMDAGVQLVLFRAKWTLQDAHASPAWEVCALGGCEQPLLRAAFYKSDHLALVHKGRGGSGTTIALREHASLEYTPLIAAEMLPSDGSGSVACLHARLLHMLASNMIRIQPLGSDENLGACASRSRNLSRVDAHKLALSHERGMASLVSKGRRVVLLDLEEEGGEDEEEEEAEEGEESIAEEAEAEVVDVGDDDEEDEDMAMDESDGGTPSAQGSPNSEEF